MGPESRLCQANGDWSLSQPTCQSRIHSTSMEEALFYLSLIQGLKSMDLINMDIMTVRIMDIMTTRIMDMLVKREED